MPTLTTKIIRSNSYFSLISININGLNSPIKRHRLRYWLHKQDPTFCCIQDTELMEKTDTTLEKRQKNNFLSK
jgi:exonuclease III